MSAPDINQGGMFARLFEFDREETPGQVLFYRAFELLIGYWVISFAWEWGIYMQQITDIVLPLGLAGYMDVSFLFENGISLMNAALMTVAFLAGLARMWKWGYAVTLLLMHFQYVGRYSLGEISHGSNVIGIALLGMALGALLYENRQHMRRFSFGFSYFLLGLGYTSAAVCKLIASGPLWVDGVHLWMWIGERTVDTFSISGTVSINMLQQAILESRLLGTLILSFGLLTELFGFLMWFRKTRTIIMLLLIGMHMGIFLSMKINFPANNALLIALALPWGVLIDRAIGWSSPTEESRRPAVVQLAERFG